jgi:uncharacterized protein YkwD
MLRLVLFLGLACCLSYTYPDDLRSDLLSEVNALRSKGCLCGDTIMLPAQPVRWHQKLALSASLHARQMQRHKFFEHYSLGGKNIGERISAVGYPWTTVGENLARGQRSVREVIQDWKRSPIHCRVMMHADFDEVGFARSGNYWVMHLGKRKAAQHRTRLSASGN